jgi:putative transposase
VARQYGGKNRNFNGEKLWARGYAVSTVGFELEKAKKYITQQEKLEKDQEDGKF